MGKKKSIDIFVDKLRKVSICSWILKLIPIPVGLVTAGLMSEIVTKATDGDVRGVVVTAAILLTVVIGMKLFDIITGIMYEKARLNALHKCKMSLYEKFFATPMHLLFKSEHGASKEKLTDDFNTVTGRHLSVYPVFWSGVITAVVYFGYLATKNVMIACILILMSFIQVIPPIIVKKYLQVNYERLRDVEAEGTDLILSSYRGFAIIKNYGLKDWWLYKLREHNKKCIKAGNTSIYTNTAENVMDGFVDMILKYGTYGIIGVTILWGKASIDVGVQAITLSVSLFAAVKTAFSKITDFAVIKTAKKRLIVWLVPYDTGSVSINGTEITLSEVGYAHDEKSVFANATATFDGGKITLIKGANGIGKSTLFRLITGMFLCENGEINIGGVNAASINIEDFPKKIFYLPQEDASFDITPDTLYKMSLGEANVKALEYARVFELTDELINNSKIRTLSGGERKKVFLSLALAVNPEILLMDEPTNSLDKAGRETLKSFLKERRGGALIITHDDVFDEIAECAYVVSEGGINIEER